MHVVVTARSLRFRPMATRPDNFDTGPAGDSRRRRLCWIALAVAVLLGAYVATVAWATRTVEAGVERSLQPLPAMVQDRPELGR